MEIELSNPQYVTADFVGEPGQRTFYLQASEDAEVVSLLLEKQQVAGIAELLTRLLAGVNAAPYRVWDIASMRLRQPVQPRWRVATIGIGIDPQLGRFAIEAEEFVAEEDEREPEVVRIWADEDQARRLAAHAAWAVEQGRPPCRLCGLPLDEGHVCPRTNGDLREA